MCSGPTGKIDLTSARAQVVGGNNMNVASGSGDVLTLYFTGGRFEAAFGDDLVAYDVSAEASFIGGGNWIRTSGAGDRLKLLSTGGEVDKVSGPNLNANLTNAQASFISGGNVIRASSSGDVVKLFAPFGKFDKAYGANLIGYLINAQESFAQGGNTIHLLNDKNDTVKLFSTGSKADSVIGCDSAIDVIGAWAKITGSNGRIALFDNNTVSLVGGSFHFLIQPGIGKATVNGFARGTPCRSARKTLRIARHCKVISRNRGRTR